MIFAKAPIPGQVKTRLCPPLTPDEAASLHGSFVLDSLERSTATVKRGSVRRGFGGMGRVVACAPSSQHVFFKILEERYGVRLIDQVGDNLGARMDHAFKTTFAMGYQRVVLVGTDVPLLPRSTYTHALSLLFHHDLILGPSLDGGYFLIGLKRPRPDLFTDIPWSTDQVLALTREKAEASGLRTALLPAQRDIDTIDDLRGLIQEAGPSAPLLSKRTAGALRLLAGRYQRELGG